MVTTERSGSLGAHQQLTPGEEEALQDDSMAAAMDKGGRRHQGMMMEALYGSRELPVS
jgi:hypothetical protein